MYGQRQLFMRDGTTPRCPEMVWSGNYSGQCDQPGLSDMKARGYDGNVCKRHAGAKKAAETRAANRAAEDAARRDRLHAENVAKNPEALSLLRGLEDAYPTGPIDESGFHGYYAFCFVGDKWVKVSAEVADSYTLQTAKAKGRLGEFGADTDTGEYGRMMADLERSLEPIVDEDDGQG